MVKLALCEMECIYLMLNAIKIPGAYNSYNSYDKNFQNQENFMNVILETEKLLGLWRMRNSSISDKITDFKTLAILKIVHLALVKAIPNSVILELDKIKKYFIWKNDNPNINQEPFVKIVKMLL